MTAAIVPATAPELDDEAFPMRRRAAALSRILDDLTIVSDAELGQLFYSEGYPVDYPPGRTSRPAPEGLIDRLPQLFARYAAAAALVTAQWYRELEPEARYDPIPMYDLSEDQVLETARWAFFAPGEESPLMRMAGSGQRMIADASRSTVVGNAAAEGVRWYRYASADACAFCQVLATRTAGGAEMPVRPSYTYKTGEWTGGAEGWGQGPTATRVGYSEYGIRGSRKTNELYHDRCRCVAVPVRGAQWRHPPSYVTDWNEDYEAARKGIEEGDELATELGIDGQTPNIRNVSQYMRHARGRETGGPATEPRALVAQEKRKEERRKAAGLPEEPKPAWMSMPRDTRDEIKDQFQARTGIMVKPDRLKPTVTAFGRTDDLQMLREYTDAIADLNDKYGLADWANENNIDVTVGTSSRVSAFAWMQPGQEIRPDGTYGDFAEIMFSRRFMGNPADMQYHSERGQVDITWDGTQVNNGALLKRSDGSYHTGPYKSKLHQDWTYTRGTSTHETFHLMDVMSGWRPTKQGEGVLMETFAGLNKIKTPPRPTVDLMTASGQRNWRDYVRDLKASFSSDQYALYTDWLIDSLPAYAFHKGHTNMLHIEEAIAESGKTIESGVKGNPAQRALHELTVREFVEAKAKREAARAAAR